MTWFGGCVFFLLLFRCSTGENFNGIMNDLSVQQPFCDPVYEQNCGYNPVVPVVFFFSFVLITTLTMMKLVVAVILDNFGNAVEMDMEKEVRRQKMWCLHRGAVS